jgi:hypothetical protein
VAQLSIDQVAKLPDDERLRVAKSLIVAAFKLCSKDHDPSALELATFMNGAVTALLSTTAERQRAEWWDCHRDQHDATAAHGLH